MLLRELRGSQEEELLWGFRPSLLTLRYWRRVSHSVLRPNYLFHVKRSDSHLDDELLEAGATSPMA